MVMPMNKETEKQYLWHLKRAKRSQQAGQQLTPMKRLILHVDGEITRLERELADARADIDRLQTSNVKLAAEVAHYGG